MRLNENQALFAECWQAFPPSTQQNHKQEGWPSPTEHASVSAISLKHILDSPGYASGTIAVNVIWMKKRFNACQTHRSMYSSLFNRLRAIAIYWSEIATFPTPLHITPSLGVFPLEFREKVWSSVNQNHGATRQWRQFDDRLSCFDTIPACDEQTD